MANLKLSAEVQHLDEDCRKRYIAKLDLVGMTDPYNLPRGLLKSPELLSLSDLPELNYIDICNYVINSPSPYTGKDLKAYKSLDAYKYFTAGWVHDGLVWKIPNTNRDCFLLMTKVNVFLFIKHVKSDSARVGLHYITYALCPNTETVTCC